MKRTSVREKGRGRGKGVWAVIGARGVIGVEATTAGVGAEAEAMTAEIGVARAAGAGATTAGIEGEVGVQARRAIERAVEAARGAGVEVVGQTSGAFISWRE